MCLISVVNVELVVFLIGSWVISLRLLGPPMLPCACFLLDCQAESKSAVKHDEVIHRAVNIEETHPTRPPTTTWMLVGVNRCVCVCVFVWLAQVSYRFVTL